MQTLSSQGRGGWKLNFFFFHMDLVLPKSVCFLLVDPSPREKGVGVSGTLPLLGGVETHGWDPLVAKKKGGWKIELAHG